MPVPRTRKRRIPSLKKKDTNPHLRTITVRGTSKGKDTEGRIHYGRVFLGLDPSLRGFGRAAVCENGALMHYPTLRGGAKLKGMKRFAYLLDELRNDLLQIVHCAKTGLYKGLVVVREDYAIHANDAADTPLKELGGALEWFLYQMEIPLYRLNITSIKKFATGRGDTDKTKVPDIVNRRFGFNGDEDAAHAFAAAITALSVVNRDKIEGTDEPMREVIGALAGHPLTKVG